MSEQERNELRAALEALQIKLTQHRDTPQPDEWFYDVAEICDGGPCESAADALRTIELSCSAAFGAIAWRRCCRMRYAVAGC